ncbi:hypothetical protein RJ122_005301 [Pseudomonas aeruginosa]|nr:hypothetical protein [Pseudomonas aeruginosa]EKM9119016.1 hypothetical protein [Pseudomonas aeruginosa]EKY1714485.1 hypothetical protein [Pseudomonas aeruginosa]ELD0139410.1 hypothetical protein [Pseudomonas aeruginosa]ELD0161775.1 hypothetical protein [Pseudomonas aeruginosa]
MSVRDEMQAIFGQMFDSVFSESVTEFAGEFPGPGVFDPVTETTTSQPVRYSGRGVFHSYEANRIDGINIHAGDIQLIALTNEVAGRPDIGHLVETAEAVGILGMPAKGYRIVRVGGDPAGVHHDLQLRKA